MALNRLKVGRGLQPVPEESAPNGTQADSGQDNAATPANLPHQCLGHTDSVTKSKATTSDRPFRSWSCDEVAAERPRDGVSEKEYRIWFPRAEVADGDPTSRDSSDWRTFREYRYTECSREGLLEKRLSVEQVHSIGKDSPTAIVQQAALPFHCVPCSMSDEDRSTILGGGTCRMLSSTKSQLYREHREQTLSRLEDNATSAAPLLKTDQKPKLSRASGETGWVEGETSECQTQNEKIEFASSKDGAMSGEEVSYPKGGAISTSAEYLFSGDDNETNYQPGSAGFQDTSLVSEDDDFDDRKCTYVKVDSVDSEVEQEGRAGKETVIGGSSLDDLGYIAEEPEDEIEERVDDDRGISAEEGHLKFETESKTSSGPESRFQEQAFSTSNIKNEFGTTSERTDASKYSLNAQNSSGLEATDDGAARGSSETEDVLQRLVGNTEDSAIQEQSAGEAPDRSRGANGVTEGPPSLDHSLSDADANELSSETRSVKSVISLRDETVPSANTSGEIVDQDTTNTISEIESKKESSLERRQSWITNHGLFLNEVLSQSTSNDETATLQQKNEAAQNDETGREDSKGDSKECSEDVSASASGSLPSSDASETVITCTWNEIAQHPENVARIEEKEGLQEDVKESPDFGVIGNSEGLEVTSSPHHDVVQTLKQRQDSVNCASTCNEEIKRHLEGAAENNSATVSKSVVANTILGIGGDVSDEKISHPAEKSAEGERNSNLMNEEQRLEILADNDCAQLKENISDFFEADALTKGLGAEEHKTACSAGTKESAVTTLGGVFSAVADPIAVSEVNHNTIGKASEDEVPGENGDAWRSVNKRPGYMPKDSQVSLEDSPEACILKESEVERLSVLKRITGVKEIIRETVEVVSSTLTDSLIKKSTVNDESLRIAKDTLKKEETLIETKLRGPRTDVNEVAESLSIKSTGNLLGEDPVRGVQAFQKGTKQSQAIDSAVVNENEKVSHSLPIDSHLLIDLENSSVQDTENMEAAEAGHGGPVAMKNVEQDVFCYSSATNVVLLEESLSASIEAGMLKDVIALTKIDDATAADASHQDDNDQGFESLPCDQALEPDDLNEAQTKEEVDDHQEPQIGDANNETADNLATLLDNLIGREEDTKMSSSNEIRNIIADTVGQNGGSSRVQRVELHNAASSEYYDGKVESEGERESAGFAEGERMTLASNADNTVQEGQETPENRCVETILRVPDEVRNSAEGESVCEACKCSVEEGTDDAASLKLQSSISAPSEADELPQCEKLHNQGRNGTQIKTSVEFAGEEYASQATNENEAANSSMETSTSVNKVIEVVEAEATDENETAHASMLTSTSVSTVGEAAEAEATNANEAVHASMETPTSVSNVVEIVEAEATNENEAAHLSMETSTSVNKVLEIEEAEATNGNEAADASMETPISVSNVVEIVEAEATDDNEAAHASMKTSTAVSEIVEAGEMVTGGEAADLDNVTDTDSTVHPESTAAPGKELIIFDDIAALGQNRGSSVEVTLKQDAAEEFACTEPPLVDGESIQAPETHAEASDNEGAEISEPNEANKHREDINVDKPSEEIIDSSIDKTKCGDIEHSFDSQVVLTLTEPQHSLQKFSDDSSIDNLHISVKLGHEDTNPSCNIEKRADEPGNKSQEYAESSTAQGDAESELAGGHSSDVGDTETEEIVNVKAPLNDVQSVDTLILHEYSPRVISETSATVDEFAKKESVHLNSDDNENAIEDGLCSERKLLCEPTAGSGDESTDLETAKLEKYGESFTKASLETSASYNQQIMIDDYSKQTPDQNTDRMPESNVCNQTKADIGHQECVGETDDAQELFKRDNVELKTAEIKTIGVNDTTFHDAGGDSLAEAHNDHLGGLSRNASVEHEDTRATLRAYAEEIVSTVLTTCVTRLEENRQNVSGVVETEDNEREFDVSGENKGEETPIEASPSDEEIQQSTSAKSEMVGQSFSGGVFEPIATRQPAFEEQMTPQRQDQVVNAEVSFSVLSSISDENEEPADETPSPPSTKEQRVEATDNDETDKTLATNANDKSLVIDRTPGSDQLGAPFSAEMENSHATQGSKGQVDAEENEVEGTVPDSTGASTEEVEPSRSECEYGALTTILSARSVTIDSVPDCTSPDALLNSELEVSPLAQLSDQHQGVVKSEVDETPDPLSTMWKQGEKTSVEDVHAELTPSEDAHAVTTGSVFSSANPDALLNAESASVQLLPPIKLQQQHPEEYTSERGSVSEAVTEEALSCAAEFNRFAHTMRGSQETGNLEVECTRRENRMAGELERMTDAFDAEVQEEGTATPPLPTSSEFGNKQSEAFEVVQPLVIWASQLSEETPKGTPPVERKPEVLTCSNEWLEKGNVSNNKDAETESAADSYSESSIPTASLNEKESIESVSEVSTRDSGQASEAVSTEAVTIDRGTDREKGETESNNEADVADPSELPAAVVCTQNKVTPVQQGGAQEREDGSMLEESNGAPDFSNNVERHHNTSLQRFIDDCSDYNTVTLQCGDRFSQKEGPEVLLKQHVENEANGPNTDKDAEESAKLQDDDDYYTAKQESTTAADNERYSLGTLSTVYESSLEYARSSIDENVATADVSATVSSDHESIGTTLPPSEPFLRDNAVVVGGIFKHDESSDESDVGDSKSSFHISKCNNERLPVDHGSDTLHRNDVSRGRLENETNDRVKQLFFQSTKESLSREVEERVSKPLDVATEVSEEATKSGISDQEAGDAQELKYMFLRRRLSTDNSVEASLGNLLSSQQKLDASRSGPWNADENLAQVTESTTDEEKQLDSGAQAPNLEYNEKPYVVSNDAVTGGANISEELRTDHSGTHEQLHQSDHVQDEQDEVAAMDFSDEEQQSLEDMHAQNYTVVADVHVSAYHKSEDIRDGKLDRQNTRDATALDESHIITNTTDDEKEVTNESIATKETQGDTRMEDNAVETEAIEAKDVNTVDHPGGPGGDDPSEKLQKTVGALKAAVMVHEETKSEALECSEEQLHSVATEADFSSDVYEHTDDGQEGDAVVEVNGEQPSEKISSSPDNQEISPQEPKGLDSGETASETTEPSKDKEEPPRRTSFSGVDESVIVPEHIPSQSGKSSTTESEGEAGNSRVSLNGDLKEAVEKFSTLVTSDDTNFAVTDKESNTMVVTPAGSVIPEITDQKVDVPEERDDEAQDEASLHTANAEPDSNAENEDSEKTGTSESIQLPTAGGENGLGETDTKHVKEDTTHNVIESVEQSERTEGGEHGASSDRVKSTRIFHKTVMRTESTRTVRKTRSFLPYLRNKNRDRARHACKESEVDVEPTEQVIVANQAFDAMSIPRRGLCPMPESPSNVCSVAIQAQPNTRDQEVQVEFDEHDCITRLVELQIAMNEQEEVRRQDMKAACELVEKLEAMQLSESLMRNQLRAMDAERREQMAREARLRDELQAWQETVQQQQLLLQQLKEDLDDTEDTLAAQRQEANRLREQMLVLQESCDSGLLMVDVLGRADKEVQTPDGGQHLLSTSSSYKGIRMDDSSPVYLDQLDQHRRLSALVSSQLEATANRIAQLRREALANRTRGGGGVGTVDDYIQDLAVRADVAHTS